MQEGRDDSGWKWGSRESSYNKCTAHIFSLSDTYGILSYAQVTAQILLPDMDQYRPDPSDTPWLCMVTGQSGVGRLVAEEEECRGMRQGKQRCVKLIEVV